MGNVPGTLQADGCWLSRASSHVCVSIAAAHASISDGVTWLPFAVSAGRHPLAIRCAHVASSP
jgi:hypothetical protein